MIQKVSCARKTFHFHEPFAIAYEQVDSADMLIVRLKDSNGTIGLGCASPDSEVTGESLDKAEIYLQQTLTPAFFTEPWEEWYRYHIKIKETFSAFPCLRSAVEEAYLSLFTARKGIHLRNIFGGYRSSSPIMVTIGIRDVSSTVASANQKVREGFKCLKLKCGLDPEADIARVMAVRDVVPNNILLVLDANQGYTLKDAQLVVKRLKDTGVALFEQPVDAKDMDGLKALTQMKQIPIIADEAVITASDALRILTGGYADGVNIKLMKCGGPLEFIQIFHMARTMGKILMLGCMYESNISMTTGAHLAAALPIEYVDLDSGPLDFYDDVVTGGAYVENGHIFPGNPLRYTDI